MTCPGCGAQTELNLDKLCMICRYCGGEWYPEPNEDGVCTLGVRAGLDCPVCRAALEEATLVRQSVVYCSGCRGVWISMAVFPKLVAALRAARHEFPVMPEPVDPRALDRVIRCPKCGGTLDTHVYGGPGNVVVDSCERCDMVWLDRGELARIAAAPDHSPVWVER